MKFKPVRCLMSLLAVGLAITPFFPISLARGAVLFSDDFTSGSTANWTQYDGNFSIVNGAYQLHSTAFANDARTVAGSTSWTDYSIELDYKITNQGLTSPPTGPSDWPSNVLFRVADIAAGQDQGHYYQLTIGPTRYDINYIYGVPNQISNLGSAKVSGFPINTWHHLTLNVIGQTASAYVDGTNVLTTSLMPQYLLDPQGPSAGAIGLKAINSSTVQFDNIVVTSVPEPSTIALLLVLLLGAAARRNPLAQQV